jgi:hypothetical protein
MASAFAGTRRGLPTTALVAGSIPTTVPEAPSTQTFPPATVMLAAPGTAMTAANRSRAKAGTVVPVDAGGGWVDGLCGLSAVPEHPAAASRTATASVLGQRGGRRGGGRRVAGIGMAQLPSQDSRLSTLSTSQQPGRFPGAEKRQRATAASRTWAPPSHSLPRALRLRQPPVRARDRPGRTAPARTNQRPDANGLMELSSIPGCDQNSHPASPSPPAEGTNHQRTNPARDGNRAA